MKRFRLPWFIWPWSHVLKLYAQREEARRFAELRTAERDLAQAMASELLAEFGAMRIELERRERESRINRANRLSRSAASRQLIQSTTQAIIAEVYPRRKQRG